MCIDWIIQLETKEKLVVYHIEDHDEFYHFLLLLLVCVSGMNYIPMKRKGAV